MRETHESHYKPNHQKHSECVGEIIRPRVARDDSGRRPVDDSEGDPEGSVGRECSKSERLSQNGEQQVSEFSCRSNTEQLLAATENASRPIARFRGTKRLTFPVTPSHIPATSWTRPPKARAIPTTIFAIVTCRARTLIEFVSFAAVQAPRSLETYLIKLSNRVLAPNAMRPSGVGFLRAGGSVKSR